MLVDLNDVIKEVERLADLSAVDREREGVYASNNQLKFLMKKLRSAASKPAVLNGIERYVSDLASSDSKILVLLDQFLGEESEDTHTQQG